MLNNIIDFAFKEGNKKCINFSGNTTLWCYKLKHLDFFTKNSLQRSEQHLLKCCYFEVGQSNYYRCTLKKWRKYSTVTQRNLPERNRIKVPTFFGFGYRYGKISPRFYDKHDEFSFFNVQMQNFHGNVS